MKNPRLSPPKHLIFDSDHFCEGTTVLVLVVLLVLLLLVLLLLVLLTRPYGGPHGSSRTWSVHGFAVSEKNPKAGAADSASVQ